MLAYIKTPDTLEVVLDGQTASVHKTHNLFNDFLSACRAQDEVRVLALMDSLKALKTTVAEVEVLGGNVFYGDLQLHGTMVERLIDAVGQGADYHAILNFIKNLMKNPASSAVQKLYDFVEFGKMPITPDGCFLAYKVVRENYKDKHSGTMDNSVGKVVEMPRGNVDPDHNNTCSSGLHFCSFQYVKSFYTNGDRLLIVKVSPEDVVAFPPDYNNTKARACKYEILWDVTEQLESAHTDPELLDESILDPDDSLEEEELDSDGRPEECEDCGHDVLHSKGVIKRKDGKYRRYRCADCGHSHYVKER